MNIIALNSEYAEPAFTKAKWWKYILSALVDGGVCFITLHLPVVQYVSIGCAIAASNSFFNWIDNNSASSPLQEESISMTYLQKEEWTGEGASAGTLHNTIWKFIDSSAVAESFKQNLRAGLTVANASARLWNTESAVSDE